MEKVDSKIVNKNKSGLLEINFKLNSGFKFNDLVSADSKFTKYAGKGKDKLKKEKSTKFKSINESEDFELETQIKDMPNGENQPITQSDEEIKDVQGAQETGDIDVDELAREYNLIPDKAVQGNNDELYTEEFSEEVPSEEYSEEVPDEEIHESLIFKTFLNWKENELSSFFKDNNF